MNSFDFGFLEYPRTCTTPSPTGEGPVGGWLVPTLVAILSLVTTILLGAMLKIVDVRNLDLDDTRYTATATTDEKIKQQIRAYGDGLVEDLFRGHKMNTFDWMNLPFLVMSSRQYKGTRLAAASVAMFAFTLHLLLMQWGWYWLLWSIPFSFFYAYFGTDFNMKAINYKLGGCGGEDMRREAFLQKVQDENYRFEPRNIYQDFSHDLTFVIPVFILQFLLISIYALTLVNQGLPCLHEWEAYVLVWLAILLKSLYHSIEFGFKSKVYFNDILVWDAALQAIKISEDGKYRDSYLVAGCDLQGNPDLTMTTEITLSAWKVRRIMSFFVNGVFEAFVSGLLIISAGNGNLQDFVLNFIAAQFILDLDDFSAWNIQTKNAFQFKTKVEVNERLNELVTKTRAKLSSRKEGWEDDDDIESGGSHRKYVEHVKEDEDKSEDSSHSQNGEKGQKMNEEMEERNEDIDDWVDNPGTRNEEAGEWVVEDLGERNEKADEWAEA